LQTIKVTGYDGTPSSFAHTATSSRTITVNNATPTPSPNPTPSPTPGPTPTPTPVTIVSPAFYVATTGNDSNAGTLSAPFLTFSKAASAMAASAQVKWTYVRSGTYSPSATLDITSSHNGCRFSYYPPDGVNTAILDGTAHTVDWLIHGYGVSNFTLDGIKLTGYGAYGILIEGGITGSGTTSIASNNTVMNCDAGNGRTSGFSSAAIAFYNNVPNSSIKNNYVHDTKAMGIILSTYNDKGMSGSVIENNRLQRCCTVTSDTGAIYLENVSRTLLDSNVTIRNNFVTDHGASGVDHVHAVYLDENTNNVAVIGNAIGPPTSSGTGNHDSSAFFVNDGKGNVIKDNLIDLGTTGQIPACIWAFNNYPGDGRGMAGNTFTNNILIMNFAGALSTYVSGDTGHMYVQGLASVTPSWFTIQDNMYYNSGGGATTSTGNYKGDTNPVVSNPLVSGSAYTIAPQSPAYNSPVSFLPIVGGWGPNNGVANPSPSPTPSTDTWDSVVSSASLSFSTDKLTATCSATDYTGHTARGTTALTGLKYWEVYVSVKTDTGNNDIGMITAADSVEGHLGVSGNQGIQLSGSGGMYFGDASINAGFAGFSQGDYIMQAFNKTTGKYWVGKNGTWYGSGNPATGANPAATLDTSKTWYPAACITTPNDADIIRPTAASCSTAAPAGFSNLS
jgi:hypothetical protein